MSRPRVPFGASLALAVVLAAAALLSTASPTRGAAPDAAAAIVAGARAELSRATRYDLTMGYYITRWRDGVDTGRRVYPGGDIDPKMGVCVEVPIRAFRAAGIDLQKLVHDDMARAPAAYGLEAGDRLDTNIDHRRVKNLNVFFKRKGKVLTTAVTADAAATWLPGDVVIWQLKGYGRTDHVGIVSDRKDPASGRPLVIHNYPDPGHTAEQDVLVRWKIAGHFRFPI